MQPRLRPVIGIDASRALSAAPTGTEGYSYHLIRALAPLLAPDAALRLYFRACPELEIAPGADSIVIPFPRLWTHGRLSWEMLRHPPDVLFVPAHVLPLIRPRHTLVTVHDLGYRYFPETHPPRQRRYLDWSTRWNARVASHILADSRATQDALVQAYGVDSDKITVVYPGYDPDLAPVQEPRRLGEVRKRYSIPGDYLLFLGRIQPRKNLLRLVEAFGQVLPQRPNLHLVLAGPTGWLGEPIATRVRELRLASHVHFPGYIDAVDKAALISGAQVFAYPSLYEGFGFPVLEAQACGTPLLASATSSLPEVVGDGGLLVDPLSVTAIAAGLQRLLEENALRHRLVEAGFRNLARFSWPAAAAQVAEILRRLSGRS